MKKVIRKRTEATCDVMTFDGRCFSTRLKLYGAYTTPERFKVAYEEKYPNIAFIIVRVTVLKTNLEIIRKY